jgi:hypothetical protein
MTKAQKAEAKMKRMQQLRHAQAVVNAGNCPDCGNKLIRNLSLPGWFQCGSLGAPGFKRHPVPECGTCNEVHEQDKFYNHNFVLRNCNFQIFFDPSPSELQELSNG